MQPRQPTLLSQLDEPIMRIIATLSNVAWVAMGGFALVANDLSVAFAVWPAVVIAVVAMAQLLTGRPDVRALLIVSAVVLTLNSLTVPADGARAPTVVALAAVGTVLSLYLQRHLIPFVAGYALAMTVVIAGSDPNRVEGLATALTAAIVFIFTTYLMRWLLQQTAIETERYRSLFFNSPVAMFEEDFTGVELFLNELREQGVEDFGEYLRDHPDGALRISGLVEIKAANAAAVRLLEAESQDQLLGQLPNRDVDALESITDQLLAVWEGATHIVTEIPKARTLRGTSLHLALSWAAPAVDGQRDLAHVSVAGVDVTESRQARTALEGLLRSKDELVATVSHELRTPLTTVVGLADELTESIETFDTKELRELVTMIANEGREVSTIVEDLLVAAQAETGNLRLHIERVEIVQLARDVKKGLPNKAILSLFLPEQEVWVLADPMRTRQIIRNLVVNAERYGGPGVRICIAVTSSAASIEVRDDGPPLPFKEREAIFDRYYRARQVPGLTSSVGLGLTVSRQLAHDMAGDLTYAHDGEEAIFELSLPLYVAEPHDLQTRREAAG